MKILIAIAHYWKPSLVAGAGSGSTGASVLPRVSAFMACLNSLKRLFGPNQYLCGNAGFGEQANSTHCHDVDIVVCTHGKDHALAFMPIKQHFTHCEVDPRMDPLCLEFVCQRELANRLDKNYDYYCFMEDDLIIRDPWFFDKLNWFNVCDLNPDQCTPVLLPRRYEASDYGPVSKLYIDGALSVEQTRAFQTVSVKQQLVGSMFNTSRAITFDRCLNPHSGCYFLTKRQMDAWAWTTSFKQDMHALANGDRPDCSFIGPLESAATLGIMRTFRIYKPSPECASFFEIEHYGTKYIDEFARNRKQP